MMSSVIFLVLAAAVPQTRSAATGRQVSTVEIRVTDRSGKPLKSAQITIDGISQREGETSASGRVTFHNVRVGTYMLRADRDAFIPLEKEFTVKLGGPAYVVAALSPLPPPAPAPAPSPASSSMGPAGDPRVLFIPDFAEKQLIGQESVKQSPIGCAGATEARLFQVREPITAHSHRDADEMLYVVAGQGTLKIGGAEQRISPGWFSMVPHGLAHSLSRKGRNPVIVLSLLSGQPCPQTVALASDVR